MDHCPSHIRLSPIFTAASNAKPTPYLEMIRTAITTLGDTNGSSEKAISNFIEQNYPDISSNHSNMLAMTLDLLQRSGLLVMHNECYKLPACDNPSSPPTPHRTRGRPPKIRPQNEPTRGPAGRPPKPMVNIVEPPKNETNIKVVPLSAKTGTTSTLPIVKRGRGRPRKNDAPLAVDQPNKVTHFAGNGAGNTCPAVLPDNSLPIEESSRRRGRPNKNAASPPKKETSVEDELRSKVKCSLLVLDHSSPPIIQRKRGPPPNIKPEDEPTRGLGRPPKAMTKIVDPPESEINIYVVLPLSANTGTSTLPNVKRGRGRPRKNDAPLAVGQPNKAIPFTGTGAANSGPAVRKRGRPKKNASSLPKKGKSVEDDRVEQT